MHSIIKSQRLPWISIQLHFRYRLLGEVTKLHKNLYNKIVTWIPMDVNYLCQIL